MDVFEFGSIIYMFNIDFKNFVIQEVLRLLEDLLQIVYRFVIFRLIVWLPVNFEEFKHLDVFVFVAIVGPINFLNCLTLMKL